GHPMSIQSHESKPHRFPWSVIVPPQTVEDYCRSVISLSWYSAAPGVVFTALVVALSRQSNIAIGSSIPALVLLISAVLLMLFSTWLLVRMKRLQAFGRIELAGVAIVLFSVNAGTDTFLLAVFFEVAGHGPVFLLILILAGVIFWAIASIRYLLRGREFVSRQGHY